MQRQDWFAVLIGVFILGAGAYLSTFPVEIIRLTGLFLMAAGVVGLLIWFGKGHSPPVLTIWGPWVLIIGGPILGALWLYYGKETKLPGFSAYSVIRLYDTPEFRRRYVFEFVSTDHAKVAFYLSASGVFTFSATDIRGESYPLEVKLGNSGIPIDRFVVLVCEVGLATNSTVMKIIVNEKEVARRELNFPLNLGNIDWKPGSLGAPVIGTNQGGVFLLGEIGIYKTTLTSSEIGRLIENVRNHYGQTFN